MAGQPGLFGYAAMSRTGDPLERLAAVVDSEVFRADLNRLSFLRFPGVNRHGICPLIGVRPCRWTGSCGGFDRGAGIAVLELDGAEIAQGGM